MVTNKYGQVLITESEGFDALYSGKVNNLYNLFFQEDICDKFNKAINTNKDPIQLLQSLNIPHEDLDLFDKTNQSTWFMPENYSSNLVEHLYSLCTTEIQRIRVDTELKLFIQHGMFDLLFYLKYLVDTMRDQNIVWGVGRGSSVASYVLFLIGVHKIDSLKFDLDISEFLKEI